MGNDNCTNFCPPNRDQEIVLPDLKAMESVRSMFEDTNVNPAVKSNNPLIAARHVTTPVNRQPQEQKLQVAQLGDIHPTKELPPPVVSREPFIPEVIQKLIQSYLIQQFVGKQLGSRPWIELSDKTMFKGDPPKDYGESRAGIFLLLQTNSYYIGEFSHNYKCEGQGMIISNDACYYKGGFLDGLAHGEGDMKQQAILVHGLWDNGNLITGKLKGDDFEYQGSFHQGKPHGHGHLRRSSNYFYEGHFQNGVYQGDGIESDDKYIYNGKWQNGVKHGRGMIEYFDGSSYTGEWLANKKDGQGTFTAVGGRKWEGLWVAGVPHKGRWQ